MSKILLYIDEDASDGAFVQALRSHGVDVLTDAKTLEEMQGQVEFLSNWHS